MGRRYRLHMFLGWSRGFGFDTYSGGPGLKRLAAIVAKIEYPGYACRSDRPARTTPSSPLRQWQDADYDVLADGKTVEGILEEGSRFEPPELRWTGRSQNILSLFRPKNSALGGRSSKK
jgi:hypothetical protein